MCKVKVQQKALRVLATWLVVVGCKRLSANRLEASSMVCVTAFGPRSRGQLNMGGKYFSNDNLSIFVLVHFLSLGFAISVSFEVMPKKLHCLYPLIFS